MTLITDVEREFMRHALGLTRCRVGYRNFYAAGGTDIDIGRSLVAKGMAVELEDRPFRPDVVFAITLTGFMAAAKRGEEMDEEETTRMLRLTATPEPAEASVPADRFEGLKQLVSDREAPAPVKEGAANDG